MTDYIEMAMPSYIIYRDVTAGQSMDPTAPLAFFPPKDSDELFDALRTKYPHLRTHSERMRDAVLEFLLEETQLPLAPMEQLPTPQTGHSATTSPWQASMQSMSSDSSTWSSPDMLGLATPSFGNSPQPQAPSLTRYTSTATTSTGTSESTPPAIDQMTGVFSLSEATQPKQRVRRKMTEAEKVEYRKRRIVKACDKCSKRKRKCQHNQPEMENIVTAKSHKISKSPPTPASEKSAIATPQPLQNAEPTYAANNMQYTDPFSTEMLISPFEDFSTLLDDPLPDVDFDEFLATDQPQWPWSATQDWTLLNPVADEFAAPHPQNTRAGYEQGLGRYQSRSQVDNSDAMFGNNINLEGENGTLWERLPNANLERPQEKQRPTHAAHVHNADSVDPYMLSGDLPVLRRSRGNDRGLVLVDDQAKNAPIPRQRVPSRDSTRDGVPTSLAGTTLRVNETAKAVKAFGNLPSRSPRRSSLQSVPLHKVVATALAGLCTAPQEQRQSFTYPRDVARHTDLLRPSIDNSMDSRNATSGGVIADMPMADTLRMRTNNAQTLERTLSTERLSDLGRLGFNATFTSSEDNERTNRDGRPAHSSSGAHATGGVLADMPMDETLRTRANSAQPTSRAVRAQRQPGFGHLDTNATSTSSKDIERTNKDVRPAHSSSGAQLLENLLRPAAEANARSASSLGEGIISSTSPSTELYMLKRRIPKSLHSNNASTALGPLLQTIPTQQQTETLREREREMVISRNTECTEGNATQVNGGAYQRLDTNVYSKPILSVHGGQGLLETASRTVHTPARNRNVANPSGDNHDRVHSASAARIPPSAVTAPTNNANEHNAEVYQASQHGNESIRYRDHFGRPARQSQAMEILISIAALGSLLLLLSMARTSPSMLLLALACPVSRGTNGRHHGSLIWAAMLERIIRVSIPWSVDARNGDDQQKKYEPAEKARGGGTLLRCPKLSSGRRSLLSSGRTIVV
ncbi:hypothetical protein LTR37_019994 [Vermiconidia calcicola]|uniref:Uncharacterized protein n=1 Tax=Vermiconidia calcicola TaxID=1690605 RepID=A0ACC3MDQ4_9PEZI|nr:hypothetical protein LTR37_019994 [Vermiconidia calcicola]